MILIDGSPGSALDPLDRGLLYGDGLFETMAVIDGRIPLWSRHLERLQTGCAALGFDSPPAARIERMLDEVCVDRRRAAARLTVTRGTGGSGYRPPAGATPACIVEGRSWPEYPAMLWTDGIRLRTCSTRLAVGGPLPGVKHLNRLEQVLARAEWEDTAVTEGLLLDADGFVVEGTMTNIFVQEGSRLVTPPVDRCGVAGVLRALVMESAGQAGLLVSEQRLRLPRLLRADAIFVTNAVVGLWPVRELEGRVFPVTDAVRDLQAVVAGIAGARP